METGISTETLELCEELGISSPEYSQIPGRNWRAKARKIMTAAERLGWQYTCGDRVGGETLMWRGGLTSELCLHAGLSQFSFEPINH